VSVSRASLWVPFVVSLAVVFALSSLLLPLTGVLPPPTVKFLGKLIVNAAHMILPIKTVLGRSAVLLQKILWLHSPVVANKSLPQHLV